MHKCTIMFCLFVTLGVFAKAQMVADTVNKNVVVIKDSRIKILMHKKAEINKRAAVVKRPTRGYRIQVLNTTDRNQALAVKSKLLSQFPQQKTYLLYQTPYFKIRIGNFVERSEANGMKKELSKMFPTGVFVIPSEIEYKSSSEKEDAN